MNRHAARILCLLLLPAALARAAEPSSPPAPAPDVSAEDVLAREARHDAALVVLDVRTPEEFAEGHVPGAINVPHDQVAQRLEELAPLRDKDLVVYCKSGRRAGLALKVLGEHGYTRLAHLSGDMQGWTAAGRPVERTPDAPSAAPKP